MVGAVVLAVAGCGGSAARQEPGGGPDAPAAPPAALDRVAQTSELRVCSTGDYRPLTYRDPADGRWSGIDVDMAGDLAATLGARPTIVPTTWANLLGDLVSDRCDIAMGGVSVTAARAQKAAFTVPYLADGKTPITRCENVAKYRSVEQINRPEVRAVVNPGGTNEQFARETLTRATIVPYPDNNTIFDAVADGRADLMVTDAIETRWQATRGKGLCAVHPEAPFTRSEKAYLVRQGDPVHEVRQPGIVAEHEERELGVHPCQLVDPVDRGPDRLRCRRVVEEGFAVGLQVRGRLAVGDDQDHRHRVRLPGQALPGQQQGVVQVRALHVDALQPDQLAELHRLGVPAERDDRQVVAPEPGGDQLVQRQRGALHRHPPALGHHRPGRVHQQRHRGARALLGLGDLDVGHVEVAGVAACLAELRVEQGARHRPGLGVAERPRPGGPGRLARGPGPAGLPLALTAPDPVGDVAQHRLPEPAQRLRREHQRAVRRALEQSLTLQLTLQVGQRPRVDGGLRAECLGERVEVDVLHPRAGVALRELLGQRVELAQLLHRAGGLAHPHRVVPAETTGALPVLAGAHAL
ncbi:transporter substrate-binding domain-containing protein [Pseudonocardia sp. KRD-291]|nr:transporter substrate-binding domain-containing protein [Pseudonocardia sp. KRD291]